MMKDINIFDLIKSGIKTELSEEYDKQVEVAVKNLESSLREKKREVIMNVLDSIEMSFLEEPNGINKFEVVIRKEI